MLLFYFFRSLPELNCSSTILYSEGSFTYKILPGPYILTKIPFEALTTQSSGVCVSSNTSSAFKNSASTSDISSIEPLNTFILPSNFVCAEFLDRKKTSSPLNVKCISDKARCSISSFYIVNVSSVFTDAIPSTLSRLRSFKKTLTVNS